MAPKPKLKVGTRGIALEDIEPTKQGTAYFEEHGEVEVRAVTEVRAGSDIVVIDGKKGVRESSPYELKYARAWLRPERFYRATEETRYPVADSGVKDDFARIATGAVQQAYVVGTNAFAADNNVPWRRTFTATRLVFRATQNCWVRFNGESRVQHFIPLGVDREFKLKVSVFFIVQDTLAGVCDVYMEG